MHACPGWSSWVAVAREPTGGQMRQCCELSPLSMRGCATFIGFNADYFLYCGSFPSLPGQCNDHQISIIIISAHSPLLSLLFLRRSYRGFLLLLRRRQHVLSLSLSLSLSLFPSLSQRWRSQGSRGERCVCRDETRCSDL